MILPYSLGIYNCIYFLPKAQIVASLGNGVHCRDIRGRDLFYVVLEVCNFTASKLYYSIHFFND